MAQQISWLTPRDAQEAHSALIQALGAENNPSQWMDFMEVAYRLLPDVLSSGRPSFDTIKNSLVGRLGFQSWRTMIEAPVSEGGLGWNWSGWVYWKRAWAVVQKWPYLRGLPLTAAEVNRLAQQTNNQDFPPNAQALEAWQEQQKTARQERRSESVESLKIQLQELKRQLQDSEKARDQAQVSAQALREQITSINQRLEESAQAVGRLEADQERLSADLKKAQRQAQQATAESEKARRIAKKYRQMSRWDHFRQSLGLD